MDSLVLFLRGDRVAGRHVVGMPKKVIIDGQIYRECGATLGDYDFVRDETNALVGFAFDVSERELRLMRPVTSVAKNVRIIGGQMLFLLAERATWRIDCVQASSWLYRAKNGLVLVGLHQWSELGRVGFALDDET